MINEKKSDNWQINRKRKGIVLEFQSHCQNRNEFGKPNDKSIQNAKLDERWFEIVHSSKIVIIFIFWPLIIFWPRWSEYVILSYNENSCQSCLIITIIWTSDTLGCRSFLNVATLAGLLLYVTTYMATILRRVATTCFAHCYYKFGGNIQTLVTVCPHPSHGKNYRVENCNAWYRSWPL